MRDETVLALVDRLYEAATDGSKWVSFLSSLSDALRAAGADLTSVQFDGSDVAVQVGTGVFGPEFQKHYSTFASQDPYLQAAIARQWFRAGTTAIGEQLVSRSRLERTAFYNEFGRFHGYIGGMTTVVKADADGVAAVSLCLREGQVFGEQDVRLMQHLYPHLRRALEVHSRLAGEIAVQGALGRGLDGSRTGAIAVTAEARVVYANDTATAVLREADGLRLDRGVLRATTARDSAALHLAIAQVAKRSWTGCQPPDMRVVARDERRPLQVVISPLSAPETFVGARAVAMILVTDPERYPEPDDARLARLYQLRPAEIAVVRLLMRDRTPREIATELCVSINTVRFHLKQLFAKTGTRRQSELVRLLLEGGCR